MGAISFTACQSSAQKEEAAKDNVEDAKQDLKDVQDNTKAENQKAVSAEEWDTFKKESEIKIRDNNIRIAELKLKMKKPGKVMNVVYSTKIDNLEQKNQDLQTRMDTYQKSQSDWASFKHEFNNDMDELGRALKDFTVDNKN